MRFQVRVEIFNIFNQVNYGNPERVVRCGGVRQHHLRRIDAADHWEGSCC